MKTKRLFTLLVVLSVLLLPSSAAYSSKHLDVSGYEMTAATQCKGVTKKKARCKNKTNNSNGYCHIHQNQAPKKR